MWGDGRGYLLKVGAGFGFETGGGFGCGGSGVAGRYPCFEGRGGGAVRHDGDKNQRLLVLCVCADSSLLPVIHKKLRCLMIYDVLSEEVRYTILTSFSFLQNHNMNIGIGLHSFIPFYFCLI